MNAAVIPPTQFGYQATNYRWFWPTAAVFTVGALVAVGHRLRSHLVVTVVFGVALVGLVVANLPRSIQAPDPGAWRQRVEQLVQVDEQLQRADIDGPVLIDDSNLGFGLPLVYPVASVLTDRGIEFRLEGEVQQRRFGESRAPDGDESSRLTILYGLAAADMRDDPSTVVYAEGEEPLALVLTPN